MFNTMNTVRPRPYPQRETGSYNAGNDGADKDGHNSGRQEHRGRQNQNNNQAEVQEAQTVIRGRAAGAAAYAPAKNPYPTTQRSAYPVQNQALRAQYPIHHVNPQQYQAMHAGYHYIPQVPSKAQLPRQQVPQRSNRVNIAQILKDFRNTIKAIATPQEIENEVNRYLQLIEQQVREPNPQVNLIQSNLKIAAALLDKYISETLHKDSKVVQNWLDALFLQRINYSYNEEEINPAFLVKFPDDDKRQEQKKEEEEHQEPVLEHETEEIPPEEIDNTAVIVPEEYDYDFNEEEEYSIVRQKIETKPNITIIPQDTRLKSLFMEAKKQAFSNNPQKAMSIFKEAFNRAGELKDSETQSRICLEIGKIYDDNDFVVQALNSYNKSLKYTTDTNVKSKAHFSMAQIYDDVNQVEPALNHYITSISYAGKSDDLIGQSGSLTRVANIFADKYDEKSAFDCYDVARKLAEQTTDDNMKGYVLSNTADACVQFRKDDRALKYYAEAVKNYEKTNALEEIAQNYKSAAELMIRFNSPNKAKSLLKKAIINSVKTSNEDLTAEINLLLASLD